MKINPEIEAILAQHFQGDELNEVISLWKKKKGHSNFIADGQLLISRDQLINSLKNIKNKNDMKQKENIQVEALLKKMDIPTLKKVIEISNKLIAVKKEAEIARLEKQIQALREA